MQDPSTLLTLRIWNDLSATTWRSDVTVLNPGAHEVGLCMVITWQQQRSRGGGGGDQLYRAKLLSTAIYPVVVPRGPLSVCAWQFSRSPQENTQIIDWRTNNVPRHVNTVWMGRPRYALPPPFPPFPWICHCWIRYFVMWLMSRMYGTVCGTKSLLMATSCTPTWRPYMIS